MVNALQKISQIKARIKRFPRRSVSMSSLRAITLLHSKLRCWWLRCHKSTHFSQGSRELRAEAEPSSDVMRWTFDNQVRHVSYVDLQPLVWISMDRVVCKLGSSQMSNVFSFLILNTNTQHIETGTRANSELIRFTHFQ